MEVIGDMKEFETKELVFGLEDSGLPNAAIVLVKNKNNKYIKELLASYKQMKFNKSNKLHDIAIPKMLENLLKHYGLVNDSKDIQILNNEIYIYPRDYFYPYSFDMKNNIFTENTKTIHHFSASWLSYFEKRDIFLERHDLTKVRNIIILPSVIYCYAVLLLSKTKIVKLNEQIKQKYRDNIWSNNLIHRKEKSR